MKCTKIKEGNQGTLRHWWCKRVASWSSTDTNRQRRGKPTLEAKGAWANAKYGTWGDSPIKSNCREVEEGKEIEAPLDINNVGERSRGIGILNSHHTYVVRIQGVLWWGLFLKRARRRSSWTTHASQGLKDRLSNTTTGQQFPAHKVKDNPCP